MATIYFLSHSPRSGVFRVGSHHLSREISLLGHDVAHVSTPYSLLHRLLRPSQKGRARAAQIGAHAAEGVVDLIPTPLLPADIRWTSGSFARVIRDVGLGHPDLIFVDQPLFLIDDFHPASVIFRPTDVFRNPALQQRAVTLAHQSDGVAATSPVVLNSFGLEQIDSQHTVIENGVEFDRFFSARTHNKEYDFVYVGAIDHRFDITALYNAARSIPNKTFAIFGPLPPNLNPAPSNVQFRGAINYSDAPSALARGRIGIMPLVDSEENRGRSPMKLYEFAAAGIPAVVPSATSYRAQGLRSLISYDPGTTGAFTEAARGALHGPPVSDDDTAEAAANDWSSIARRLLKFAAKATGRESLEL